MSLAHKEKRTVQELLSEARQALEALLNESTDALDVVLVKRALSAAADRVASTERVFSDERELRSDLCERIRAMDRAIRVARRGGTEIAQMELDEDAADAPAGELLLRYRRICARFRDTFPGSPGFSAGAAGGARDWSEFKL
ncbi:MAG TPA: hypothetical protein VLB27_05305 [candidate division Zixibacteria bacterium]|nr:hypothetical protein [candidate division Zixibacteria bacterium]